MRQYIDSIPKFNQTHVKLVRVIARAAFMVLCFSQSLHAQKCTGNTQVGCTPAGATCTLSKSGPTGKCTTLDGNLPPGERSCACVVTPVAVPSLVAQCTQCGGLVSSTGNLYFTDFRAGVSFFRRTGKTSAPGTELLIGQEPGFQYGNVVWALVGGTYYGYIVANANQSTGQVSFIKRIPLAGGAPVTLAQSPAYIGAADLATDGSALFWSDAGGVRTMSINGGPVQTLVASTSVSHIVQDPNHVYYSEGTRISSVAKTGGATTVLKFAYTAITALGLYSANANFANIIWGQQDGAVYGTDNHGSSLITWQKALPSRAVTSVGYDGMRALWIDCAQPGNTQCNVTVQRGFPTPTTVNAGPSAGHVQWDTTSMYWVGGPGIQKYVY